MESVGAFFDEEWESLSKMFSTEDSDFLLHLHGDESFSNPVENMFINSEIPPKFFPSNHTEIDKIFCPIEQNYVNFHDQSTGFCTMDLKDDSHFPVSFPDNHVMDDRTGIAHPSEMVDSIKEMEHFKRNLETHQEKLEENISPKKKSRVSNASRNKAPIAQQKKNKNVNQICNDEVEETNGGEKKGKSSSSNSSEDDCNGSQEINGGENAESKGSALTVNSNGKAKASRGSATDPQSLYARRRRERINERLRILQNLVPNGTKVDISTMLEEAVHYVKFLQLQIKLLSSDEMWMYAPIAYNGMDMGLYEKISTPPFY